MAIPLLCLVFAGIVGVILVSQTINDNARKNEVWRAFAQSINGQFVPSSAGKVDQVTATLGDRPFYLDTYLFGARSRVVNCTRMRIFYPVRVTFELHISHAEAGEKTEFTNEAKHMSTIPLSAEMNTHYSASTNDIELTRTLANADIIREIHECQVTELCVRGRRDWKNEGTSHSVYEIRLLKDGVITDVAELDRIYRLIVHCLKQLDAHGVAGHFTGTRPI